MPLCRAVTARGVTAVLTARRAALAGGRQSCRKSHFDPKDHPAHILPFPTKFKDRVDGWPMSNLPFGPGKTKYGVIVGGTIFAALSFAWPFILVQYQMRKQSGM